MKKLVPFIVTLLSLTGCSWCITPGSEPQSSNSQSGEAPSEAPSSSIPFSTFPISYPLEGQINKPNKQFNTKVEEAVDADYVNALDQFALDFYGLLDNDENQVFSPLSIATCYSMLYEGCDGKTKEELENMLHYDDSFNHLEEIQNMLLRCAINDTEKGTYLDIAQSVWTKKSGIFKQEYIDYLTNNYYAEAFNNIDFATTGKQLCADWVNSKTNNFLNVQASDFESFNGLTAMVLFNTIYLKSNWGVSDLFAEESNIESEFTNRDNSKSTVTYMRGMNRDSTFYYTDKYTISSLPYCNGISSRFIEAQHVGQSCVERHDAGFGKRPVGILLAGFGMHRLAMSHYDKSLLHGVPPARPGKACLQFDQAHHIMRAESALLLLTYQEGVPSTPGHTASCEAKGSASFERSVHTL